MALSLSVMRATQGLFRLGAWLRNGETGMIMLDC